MRGGMPTGALGAAEREHSHAQIVQFFATHLK
jgi:hypothetical protein